MAEPYIGFSEDLCTITRKLDGIIELLEKIHDNQPVHSRPVEVVPCTCMEKVSAENPYCPVHRHIWDDRNEMGSIIAIDALATVLERIE